MWPTNYGGPAGDNGQPTGGGNGVYIFKTNVVGSFSFNNALGDPDPGFEKFGYVQINQGQLLQMPVTSTPESPRITSASLSPAPAKQFNLRFAVVPNRNYTVQVSTDLVAGDWISLFTTNSTSNAEIWVTDPNATNAQRFYRVFMEP